MIFEHIIYIIIEYKYSKYITRIIEILFKNKNSI